MTFSPAPPPPTLPGEGYFCVFNGIMSPLELSMGSNTGTCSVQDIVFQVTDIQLGNSYIGSFNHCFHVLFNSHISLDATFSIYSNRTGVNFYIRPTNYTFYNCLTAQE